jgi:hypothetical protein
LELRAQEVADADSLNRREILETDLGPLNEVGRLCCDSNRLKGTGHLLMEERQQETTTALSKFV